MGVLPCPFPRGLLSIPHVIYHSYSIIPRALFQAHSPLFPIPSVNSFYVSFILKKIFRSPIKPSVLSAPTILCSSPMNRMILFFSAPAFRVQIILCHIHTVLQWRGRRGFFRHNPFKKATKELARTHVFCKAFIC